MAKILKNGILGLNKNFLKIYNSDWYLNFKY